MQFSRNQINKIWCKHVFLLTWIQSNWIQDSSDLLPPRLLLAGLINRKTWFKKCHIDANFFLIAFNGNSVQHFYVFVSFRLASFADSHFNYISLNYWTVQSLINCHWFPIPGIMRSARRSRGTLQGVGVHARRKSSLSSPLHCRWKRKILSILIRRQSCVCQYLISKSTACSNYVSTNVLKMFETFEAKAFISFVMDFHIFCFYF